MYPNVMYPALPISLLVNDPERNDYYPFGMQMSGRSYLAPASAGAQSQYRYGFNGKEKDKDIDNGVDYDYGFRIYDSRLGRFLSEDPLTKKYPMLTPYQFASNTAIMAIDLDGKEGIAYQIFKAAGITKASGDEITAKTVKAMETAGRVSHDVLIVGGGVLTVVGSGGAALPIVLGSVAAAGGTAKLYFDAKGDVDKSEATPTTVSGVVMVTVNYAVGKEVFSQKIQATVSFAEGVATMDLKNLKSPDIVKRSGETLNLLNLAIDAASIPDNLKGLLSAQSIVSTNADANNKLTPKPDVAVADHTYVAKKVYPKLPVKKSTQKQEQKKNPQIKTTN